MKSLKFTMIIALLAISATYTSCKKDEKDGGSFILNDNTYALDHGYIAQMEDYTFGVALCSSGLDFDGSKDTPVVGNGDAILFIFGNFDNRTELATGNYICPYTLDNYKLLYDSYILVNFNSEALTGNEYIIDDTKNGTVEITKNGEDYSLNWDFVVGGNHLTGSYSGKLTSVEYSLKLKDHFYSFEK
jgi:hypothetical protein